MGTLTVRNGWLVLLSTLFSVWVCATSSFCMMTSFFNILMAYSLEVAFSLQRMTFPNVPFPRTLRNSKLSRVIFLLPVDFEMAVPWMEHFSLRSSTVSWLPDAMSTSSHITDILADTIFMASTHSSLQSRKVSQRERAEIKNLPLLFSFYVEHSFYDRCTLQSSNYESVRFGSVNSHYLTVFHGKIVQGVT